MIECWAELIPCHFKKGKVSDRIEAMTGSTIPGGFNCEIPLTSSAITMARPLMCINVSRVSFLLFTKCLTDQDASRCGYDKNHNLDS